MEHPRRRWSALVAAVAATLAVSSTALAGGCGYSGYADGHARYIHYAGYDGGYAYDYGYVVSYGYGHDDRACDKGRRGYHKHKRGHKACGHKGRCDCAHGHRRHCDRDHRGHRRHADCDRGPRFKGSRRDRDLRDQYLLTYFPEKDRAKGIRPCEIERKIHRIERKQKRIERKLDCGRDALSRKAERKLERKLCKLERKQDRLERKRRHKRHRGH